MKIKINVKAALWAVFVIYTLWLIYMMFIGVSRNSSGFYRYNLIPFATIKNYVVNYSHFNFDTWFINLFGNIAVFIPFGIFLPLLFFKLQRVFSFLAAFIISITSLEVLQMVFQVGSFDVDDILLNSVGALMGYGLYRMNWNIKD
jgi:glycopeptide antibiotics resistance protein